MLHSLSTCRACGEPVETQKHVVEDCKVLHLVGEYKVYNKEIFSDNPNKLRTTATNIQNIMDQLNNIAENEVTTTPKQPKTKQTSTARQKNGLSSPATRGSTQWWWQATGLDAWASRVKCPARFMSHLHEICIYIWVVYSLCFFCCLFITVTWWYVWCFEWASGNQEEVQACLVTLWLFIISCYSLYKTTLGLLCSWFENNPHFHKYSMDFHV